ncbi:MAG: hypothetical protein LBR53_07230 [Deltaproteobacteria bacterium]|nr:hypothetical protein [Deltaproteobacteria bacterium]
MTKKILNRGPSPLRGTRTAYPPGGPEAAKSPELPAIYLGNHPQSIGFSAPKVKD